MIQDQGYTYLRSFRYERKFLVEKLLPSQVEVIIKRHPRLFISPYPPRFVNNLYLDTPSMENYHDNVGGAEHRRKVRIRWYGEPFGCIASPMLEIKIKEGMVGTKKTFPLSPIQMDINFNKRLLVDTLSISSLPVPLFHDLRSLEIVLFNRYHRQYYATRDGAFRCTLDSQMTFYKANGLIGNQFVHRQLNSRNLVVELKYEKEQEHHASRVASYFPFRVTRNSKYIEGIERVYF